MAGNRSTVGFFKRPQTLTVSSYFSGVYKFASKRLIQWDMGCLLGERRPGGKWSDCKNSSSECQQRE